MTPIAEAVVDRSTCRDEAVKNDLWEPTARKSRERKEQDRSSMALRALKWKFYVFPFPL